MPVVDVDAAALAVAVGPYVVAAVTAYGQAVLTQVEDASAAASVRLGGQVLRRIFRRKESSVAVEQAVTELAETPDDPDRTAVLRAELRRALQADAGLAADIAGMIREAGVTVTALGPRSVAVEHNTGIVQTGDSSAAWQGLGPR